LIPFLRNQGERRHMLHSVGGGGPHGFRSAHPPDLCAARTTQSAPCVNKAAESVHDWSVKKVLACQQHADMDIARTPVSGRHPCAVERKSVTWESQPVDLRHARRFWSDASIRISRPNRRNLPATGDSSRCHVCILTCSRRRPGSKTGLP
jgi:hypothetical protein